MTQPPLVIPSDVEVAQAGKSLLANGSTLYTLASDDFEVLRVTFVFRAGSAMQRVPFSASAAANMLAEGTRDMTAHQIAEQLDYYGSWYDVNVDRDYVYISFCSLSKYFRQTLAVAEQILLHPLFPEEEVASYREKRKQRLRIERMKVETEAREAFARVAKELIRRGDEKPNFPDSLGITEATNRELAIRLLDEGMRRMPPAQVRYTSNNTLPFIEAYYAAGAADKGDALMLDYARNLMEYVDYYFQFDGWQYDSITDALDEKLDLLGNLYSMAGYLKRDAVLTELNAYYRSLGVTEEELIQPDSAHLDYEVSDTAAVN